MKNLIYIFLLVHLPCSFVFSQELKPKTWDLKGYIKDIQNTSFIDDAASVTTLNLIHNRINFKWNFAGQWQTRLEIRNRIFYGEQVKLIPGFGKFIGQDNGYMNLSVLWVDVKSIAVHSVFDRALLNYSTQKINIMAGRQRINWGINTVWNPNDLFNASNFLDFDYEERPGTDGLRVQYSTNSFSIIEGAFKPSKNKNETVLAFLLKTNKWKYDLQLLGGIYEKDLVVGGGWAGNILEAGFKGEVSYFHPKKNPGEENGTWSLSATLDYSFKNNWYVSGAMLYQSEPAIQIEGNPLLFNSALSAKNLMPYQYTFYANVMKGFSPIVSGNFACIYSPTNNSMIFFPAVAWSAANNFDVSLTIQSFFAETFRVFRTQGNAIYLGFKWSF